MGTSRVMVPVKIGFSVQLLPPDPVQVVFPFAAVLIEQLASPDSSSTKSRVTYRMPGLLSVM